MTGDGKQEAFDFAPPVYTRPLIKRRLRREEWVAELESATSLWREHRAREYERAGERSLDWWQTDRLQGNDDRLRRFIEIVRDGDDEPTNVQAVTPIPDDYWDVKPSTMPLPIPAWHANRATAQRERWSLLNTCGSQQVTTRCDCKGHKPRSTQLKCDHWRLCIECRGRRKQRYQARFSRGRDAAVKRLRPLLNRRGGEGRWSEKMLTLTVPHSGDAGADIVELRNAWPKLRGSIARYLKRKGSHAWREVPYWRSMEVTSSDGGHAHYHVWLLCPYLPQALVAHWWGRALSESYRARLPRTPIYVLNTDERDRAEWVRASRRGFGFRTWLYAPVVDLRAANEDARGELVKYLVKDAVGDPRDGFFIEPHVYARIYAAMEGARAVSTSTKWWVVVREGCFCESCGAQLSRVIEDVPQTAEAGTGPPQA